MQKARMWFLSSLISCGFFLRGVVIPPPNTSQAAIANSLSVNEVVGVNINASTWKLRKLTFMCKS
jgi:hypothetical protein